MRSSPAAAPDQAATMDAPAVVEPFSGSGPTDEPETAGTGTTGTEITDGARETAATHQKENDREAAAEVTATAPAPGSVLAAISASLAAAAAIVGVILLTLLGRQRKLEKAAAAGNHGAYAAG